jgi:glucose-1-phosphate thymidylyltransferase
VGLTWNEGDGVMKGIILHGGRGTRLRPLTNTGPKQLIPVANKPISQYALEDLIEAGVKDVAFVLGDIGPERVIQYYGNGSKFNVAVSYIHQDGPRGIAHAIGLCKGFVGDGPFVVYLGDNILKSGIRNFKEEFVKSKYDAMILLCEIENPQRFGVAKFEDGKLVGLVEKPEVPPSNYALVGVYFFRPPVFDAIEELKPSWRGELEITEAIQRLMDRGYKVGHRIVSGWWKDTGKPEDLLEANQLVLTDLEPFNRGTADEGVVITGRVGIDEGTTIRRGCTIRGPVIIGRNCDIGPNTYVGPYTSIGDNVIIRGGEVENTIIEGDTAIECGKRIVDSLIGRASKITSTDENLPKGYKLIIGEHTLVSI